MGYIDMMIVIIIVGSCAKLIEDIKDFVVDNELLLRFGRWSVLWSIPMYAVHIIGIYTMVATENDIDYRLKGVIIGILVSGILVAAYYEKTITYKGIIMNSKLYKWKKIISYSYDEDNDNTILFRTKENDEIKLKLKESNIKDVENLLNKKIKNKEISNQI